MKLRAFTGIICGVLLTMGTALQAQLIAFPGAEGFGKFTTGGRGGKVYTVSNLNDNGPGSFREAAEAKHPRYIVFAVAGTIHLTKAVHIKANATIAGHTAPGGGICIADMPVLLDGDNIIVRYMRFRLGDRFQNKGMEPGSGHDDAFGGNRHKNIIIDHCTMSWSSDELFSMYGGDSSTIQWCLLSEPLNYSYHFERGDKDFERHGYGGIWGGKHLTAHHNLIAHCVSRTPRFQGVRYGEEKELVHFANNVIYNWQHNNVYGGEGGHYNIVNNYYKAGPDTYEKVRNRIVNPSKLNDTISFGYYHVSGNIVTGFKDVSRNNVLGIHLRNAEEKKSFEPNLSQIPHPHVALPAVSADAAYKNVLTNAGAILPIRDTLDARIVNDVQECKGRIIDVQGGHPHGTPYSISATAWPALATAPAPIDNDGDGIPDAWETVLKLNPADATDATIKSTPSGYDNIEIYLHRLEQQQMQQRKQQKK